MELLKKYFEKVLKLRQIVDGCALSSREPYDIYTVTDQVDSLFKEGIEFTKERNMAGLSNGFSDGVRIIKLMKNEELKVLPKHKTQRDQNATFKYVKEYLQYHLNWVITDIDKVIKDDNATR